MSRRLTRDEFIEKAIKVHGNKFDYRQVVYERWNKKISIICPNNHIFIQTPK